MIQNLKTPALMLRRLNYSESDRIVALYTRQHGRISALARSARKSSRRFGASLEPFVLFEAELTVYSDRDLAALKQAQPLRVYRGLLKDLRRLGLAYRILELMDIMEPEPQAEPALFDRLDAALRDLEVNPAPLKTLLAFEADLLSHAGFAPVLDRCCVCGKSRPFGKGYFSLFQGGLVCPLCRVKTQCQDLQGLEIPLAALFNGLQPEGDPRDLARFMDQYLLHHLERPLKTSYLSEAFF